MVDQLAEVAVGRPNHLDGRRGRSEVQRLLWEAKSMVVANDRGGGGDGRWVRGFEVEGMWCWREDEVVVVD